MLTVYFFWVIHFVSKLKESKVNELKAWNAAEPSTKRSEFHQNPYHFNLTCTGQVCKQNFFYTRCHIKQRFKKGLKFLNCTKNQICKTSSVRILSQSKEINIEKNENQTTCY